MALAARDVERFETFAGQFATQGVRVESYSSRVRGSPARACGRLAEPANRHERVGPSSGLEAGPSRTCDVDHVGIVAANAVATAIVPVPDTVPITRRANVSGLEVAAPSRQVPEVRIAGTRRLGVAVW
jgi:hypothetical protein